MKILFIVELHIAFQSNNKKGTRKPKQMHCRTGQGKEPQLARGNQWAFYKLGQGFEFKMTMKQIPLQGLHSLKKSLNFRGSPWKVLKFLCKALKSPWIFFNFEWLVAWKEFSDAFWLYKNVNHSLENVKVIYIKCSMFYSIINYQFKTSELKNVEKLVKQTVQTLKCY